MEHTPDAGSYRGEFLDLMAIHLIFLMVNKFSPDLRGLVHILLDCQGALNKVKNIPPYQIPTHCSHLDILKNKMSNCSDLLFLQLFSHVKAHQDDGQAYGELPCETQLNCHMDYLAKTVIHGAQPDLDARTRRFPLKPLCVFLGRNKLSSDKRANLKFWAHKQFLRTRFHKAGILHTHQFDKVNWEIMHTALYCGPCMFQIWACKQVMDIAPAYANRHWEGSLCPLCPSCAVCTSP
jgi:hypothetical protein